MTESTSRPTFEQGGEAHLSKPLWLCLFVVFAFGVFIRIYPTTNHTPSAKADRVHPNVSQIGFDEDCYRRYLMTLEAKGLQGYPEMARNYVATQPKLSSAILPPTRVTFLVSSYLCYLVSNASPLACLRAVSCAFGILSLIVAGLFAWRLGGPIKTVAIVALLSCAPLEIQMAQRAYIDGIFACWTLLALWLLWENLQEPNQLGWLAAYTLGLMFMVLTKENAAFVFAAIFGIIVLNRWIGFGKVTWKLLAATFVGPSLGVLLLIIAAGGLQTLIDVYRINVEKSMVLPYAIQTGDGPWHLYILDLLLISPVVTLLALAGFLNSRPGDKPGMYFVLFITFTYLIMMNVKYGMNLRYASIWDMPMRWLAVGTLTDVAGRLPKRIGRYFLPGAIFMLCALDLNHYFVFFARHGLYDPIPEYMLRILNILK